MANNFQQLWNEGVNKIMSILPQKWLGHVVLFIIILVIFIGLVNGIVSIRNFFWKEKPSKLEILDFVEKCQWGSGKNEGGNYASCKEIITLTNKYPKDSFIEGQYDVIVSQYGDITRVVTFYPPVMPAEDGTLKYGLQLETKSLQADSKFGWKVNARGSYLLRYRPEKSVPEKLIKIMQSHTSAFVRVVALDSYCFITKYLRKNVFDFDGAKEHFEKNRDKILKNMKEDGSVQLEIGEPIPQNQIKEIKL